MRVDPSPEPRRDGAVSIDGAPNRRVLHVIEDMDIGGAEKLLASLLPLLPPRGVAIELAVLGRRGDLLSPLRAAGIAVHVLGLPSHRRPRAAINGLRRLLTGRFHLVHTHLARANLYGRLAARGRVPVTTTYHDSDYEPEVRLDNPGFRPWKQWAYRILDRLTLDMSTPVVAVSRFVGRSLERRLWLARSRVRIIPNGVGAEALGDPTPGESASVRVELGFPPEAFVVVQVGRLAPQKGPLHTVAAAASLVDRPQVRWVLVGSGPLREAIETAVVGAGLSGRVVLVGSRFDVPRYLHAADAFVFPSMHEGLGIAALEAMAASLPVVAYRTGPLPEVVVDGETGILVPPGDPQALAEGLRRLVDDPERRSRLGENGRVRVREHFLIEKTADRHVAFYSEAGRAPGRSDQGDP